jgi:outer membrane protein assembly factor BamB
MSTKQRHESSPRPLLRLWPGIALAILLVVVRYGLPLIAPEGELFSIPLVIFAMLAGVVLGFAILLWWLFASRASWSERLGALAVTVVAWAATWLVVDESIRGGHMGMMMPLYSIPALGLALVAGAAAGQRLAPRLRGVVVTTALVLGCGVFALLRTDGITGDGASQLHWRWTPTAEQQLLAEERGLVLPPLSAPATQSGSAPRQGGQPAAMAVDAGRNEPRPVEPSAAGTALDNAGEKPSSVGADPGAARAAEWPGFRGPHRDAVVQSVQLDTDWSQHPPAELWRRPVGPGWSSFAVAGDLIYTQEQRGDEEVVACYRLSSGELVWRHADPVRFYESNGGAGPRGTPTLHDGRVYTFGATGIVNALDARSGAVVWSRNASADTGVAVPDWGFASSPLVTAGVVVVAASGQLIAYDIGSGDQRWLGPRGGAGYSSPHLVSIHGVPQILLLRGSRTISVAPADGTLLWEHVWQPGVGITQPAMTTDGDVLLTVGDAMGGLGIRRVAVAHDGEGWTAEERWTSRGLKPYFNDFVVHEGHAYGFDGSILASIDLSTGERKWKGGRYGNGQLMLLADQDLLFVVSEDGELALVSATPDKYAELARVPALNSKTWNHPVMAGGVLLVRNGEEMAAFRLPLAGR